MILKTKFGDIEVELIHSSPKKILSDVLYFEIYDYSSYENLKEAVARIEKFINKSRKKG